jgi:MoaA/NifB/PqqE/SkfB family radical SAM enzyme
MLRAYIRKYGRQAVRKVTNLALRAPSRRWIAAQFRDFVPLEGTRGAMLAMIGAQLRHALSELQPWLDGRDGGRALAEALENGCNAINAECGLADSKLRSYVDVGAGVRVLRRFAEHLASIASGTMPIDAIEITQMMLEHRPNSRIALLAHAELLLDCKDVDAAIDAIRRALRVQAVCTTAEKMLFDAYRMKREMGSDDPELAVLDYDLSDKFCHLPFTHMSTGVRGETFACACPAWVPFSIGNVLTSESGDAIWNSDVAAEIRRSILDGDFSYCSRTQCSFIAGQKLPRKSEVAREPLRGYIENRSTRIAEMPAMLELNHDATCNLACPSCRTEIVSAKSDEVDLYERASERVILPMLKKVAGQTYITGGGEAFASKHFRSILRALNRDEFPALYVFLITNGQLLTPYRWSEFPRLPEMIEVLAVSVDAARAETYEKLRRPGKWNVLMRNLEFIAEMKRTNQIRHFGLNFVVQRDNFREMLDFIDLADRLGADRIWFQRAVNYGAWDEATFAELDVSSPSHPDHAELLAILRNPAFKHPEMNAHMLQILLPEWVASEEKLQYLY